MKSILFECGMGRKVPRELQLQRLRLIIQAELTDLQRQTLIAYYFDDRSLAQIAEERGVTKPTVWRTLKRAEEKLRRFMKY